MTFWMFGGGVVGGSSVGIVGIVGRGGFGECGLCVVGTVEGGRVR